MSVSDGDRQATKIARGVFARKGIDLGMADLRVIHGIVYVRGTVSAAAGLRAPNLKAELENVGKQLRAKPEIRDVVFDCNIRG
jgi:hypothetical protein